MHCAARSARRCMGFSGNLEVVEIAARARDAAARETDRRDQHRLNGMGEQRWNWRAVDPVLPCGRSQGPASAHATSPFRPSEILRVSHSAAPEQFRLRSRSAPSDELAASSCDQPNTPRGLIARPGVRPPRDVQYVMLGGFKRCPRSRRAAAAAPVNVAVRQRIRCTRAARGGRSDPWSACGVRARASAEGSRLRHGEPRLDTPPGAAL